MRFLKILESFFDETQIAGYSLSSLLEYWWIGAIVVGAGGAAVAEPAFLWEEVIFPVGKAWLNGSSLQWPLAH